MLQAPAKRSPEFWGKMFGFPSFFANAEKPGKSLEKPGKPWQNFPRFPGFSLCAKNPRSFWLEWFLALPGSSLIPGFPGKPRDSLLAYLGGWSESRENARASGEAPRGRGKAPRSCVLARLSSLAQIGELARRLAKTKYFTLSGGIWLGFLALPCSSLIPRFPGKPRKAKRKWSMFSGLFLGQKGLEFELLTSMILSSLGSSLIPGFPGKPRKAKRNYSILSRLLLFKKAWNPCSLKHDHLSWFWGFLESVVKPGKPRKNFPSFPGLCLHVQKSWNFWLSTISGCHGSSTFRKAWKAKEKFPCF